jgi:demethylmenaquinone methyltransferase/2-methoxy-6-polyprenyl-1,4-benzoquinol methylase
LEAAAGRSTIGYSFSVLPRLGQFAAGDGDSYRYLAESIRMHRTRMRSRR